MHYLTISYHPLPLPRPWQRHLCTAGQQNGKNATGAAHSLAKDTFSCPVHSASDSFSFLPVFSCITYLLLWFVRLIMRSCQGDTRRITTTLRRRDEQYCWAKTLEVIPRRSDFNDDTVSDNKDLLEWERRSFIEFICRAQIQQM